MTSDPVTPGESRERFRRLESLFRKVGELPPAQREAYLAEQCKGDSALKAQVLGMLQAEHSPTAGMFDKPAYGDGVRVFEITPAPQSQPLPEHIGQYRIVRVIGEGGMGIVYEAEQSNPRRHVALKVIRRQTASPALIRRFQQEGQILGRLQHPGIAQILEAGTADDGGEGSGRGGPQPFIVMEFVHGRPLLEHAREQKLSRRERLELMALICDAVHYAHQHDVVHRDLKPANILVPDAQTRVMSASTSVRLAHPKILDFGVARLTDADLQVTQHTTVGELVGTVPYMSPEQAAGDPTQLDWRSDVYSLGVILFELLTGRLPQEVRAMMVHEAVRAIREDEPTLAGSIDRSLRGDIQTIIAKALEKDKFRRYQSAAELAADIRRHLNEQPISARPASALYRMHKFARRNKAIVAGVAVAFAAMMVATVISLRQAVIAESARQQERELRIVADQRTIDADLARVEAEQAREEAEAVSAFLATMLGAADPEVMGKDVRIVDVLAHAASDIDEQFPNQPSVRSTLRRNIGITYRRLGLLDEAELQLLLSVSDAKVAYDTDHPSLLRALNSLAVLYDDQHRYDRSLPMYEEILAIQRRTLGPSHRQTLGTSCNLGLTLYDLGRFEEAAEVLESTLNDMREALGSADRFTLNALQGLGTTRMRQERFDEAVQAFQEVLETATQALGSTDQRAISALSNLAEVNMQRQQPAAALALLDDALDRVREQLPEGHWRIGNFLYLRGVALTQLERFDEAEASLRSAHGIFLATYGPDGSMTTETAAALARLEEATEGWRR
jgi:eukaryotic-like serine/threonine-protein kinase